MCWLFCNQFGITHLLTPVLFKSHQQTNFNKIGFITIESLYYLDFLYQRIRLKNSSLPFEKFENPEALPSVKRKRLSICIRFICIIFQGPTYDIQYLYFSVWLILLSIIFSRFVNIATNGNISIFFMAELYSITYMYTGNIWASLVAQIVKNLSEMQETWV